MGTSELDLCIKIFHEAEDKEIELFLHFDHGAVWPDPPSSRLWFDGLKKFGSVFAEREYALRNG